MRLESLCTDFFKVILKHRPFSIQMKTTSIESKLLKPHTIDSLKQTLAFETPREDSSKEAQEKLDTVSK